MDEFGEFRKRMMGENLSILNDYIQILEDGLPSMRCHRAINDTKKKIQILKEVVAAKS